MLIPPEMQLNPYPMYAMMRQLNPVYHDADSGTYSVFRYDDVKRALTEHETFSSQFNPEGREQGGLSTSLITTDPPRHTKLRALISRAFTPRAIANLEPRIQQWTNELLDHVIETGRLDLVHDLSSPLPVTVIAELMGIPAADRLKFKEWSDIIVASSSATVKPDPVIAEQLRVALPEMRDYFMPIFQQRRIEPRDDLISALLAAELEGERLDDEDVFAFAWLLLVAGNETTTNLISNAILTFLELPEVLTQIKNDSALLPAAIEEVLRYRSPVQAMFRVMKTDIELAGQTIPAGKMVIAWIGSANRDEIKFANPDGFDLARSPNQHIAFGNGIHFCLGAPLARLEARIVLNVMLARLQNLARADDSPLEPLEGLVVQGVKRLPLTFAAGQRVS
jgi:cytochrome P450